MSLRTAVRKAARAAVSAVGDLATTVTYCEFVSATYDADEGSTVTTYTSHAGVMVVITGFSFVERMADGDIQNKVIDTDARKVVIPAANISGVTPNLRDKIVTDGGDTYEPIMIDSAIEELWKIMSRKS